MLFEQPGQLRDVAIAGGREDLAVERQRVNVRLERAPARKAVLLGERELRISELRVRVGLLKLVQATLSLFAEPIQIGMFGKRQAAPSFLREGRALSGRP